MKNDERLGIMVSWSVLQKVMTLVHNQTMGRFTIYGISVGGKDTDLSYELHLKTSARSMTQESYSLLISYVRGVIDGLKAN